jgi:hypothetical protein
VNPPDVLPVVAGQIYAGSKCDIPPQPENMGTYKNAEGAESDSENDDLDSSSGRHRLHKWDRTDLRGVL